MLHRHSNLALVVVHLLDHALVPAESDTLDRVTLSLAAAGLHDFGVRDRAAFDFDLALHQVACLKNGRLEAV